jgi:hypothetical protein
MHRKATTIPSCWSISLSNHHHHPSISVFYVAERQKNKIPRLETYKVVLEKNLYFINKACK